MKAVKLPFEVKRAVLACGADLKGAFALAKGSRAYLFDGFGDLADIDNFERYVRAVKAAVKRLKISPKLVACDLHPDYFSTRFAEDFLRTTNDERRTTRGAILRRIQHHEAHIAAAMVDSGIRGNVIGVAFDGTGYGSDGNIWGGEFFLGALRSFERAAHLEYVPMPGGEACVRQPWRMAASYMHKALLGKGICNKTWPAIKEMMDKKINSPLTSSAGRLFDAVGSIVLRKDNARFEAELPAGLERIASAGCYGSYDFRIKPDGVISVPEIFKGIMRDLLKRTDKAEISAKFHNTVACIIAKVSLKLRKRSGVNKIVLAGGVFQNKFLTGRAIMMLVKSGFDLYASSGVPVHDGGIPVGQVAVANGRIKL